MFAYSGSPARAGVRSFEMAMHQKDIERLLEPELTATWKRSLSVSSGLAGTRADAPEVALSYVRRLLQGELDIVAAELEDGAGSRRPR